MEIVLVVLPRHNGNLIVLGMLAPVMQSYLTRIGRVYTLNCKIERRLSAIVSWVNVSLEMTSISCVHGMNNLMAMESADRL